MWNKFLLDLNCKVLSDSLSEASEVILLVKKHSSSKNSSVDFVQRK